MCVCGGGGDSRHPPQGQGAGPSLTHRLPSHSSQRPNWVERHKCSYTEGRCNWRKHHQLPPPASSALLPLNRPLLSLLAPSLVLQYKSMTSGHSLGPHGALVFAPAKQEQFYSFIPPSSFFFHAMGLPLWYWFLVRKQSLACCHPDTTP